VCLIWPSQKHISFTQNYVWLTLHFNSYISHRNLTEIVAVVHEILMVTMYIKLIKYSTSHSSSFTVSSATRNIYTQQCFI